MKPKVETSYGRIQGVEDSGLYIFQGVRFASPPAGRRRFLPPVPPKPWKRTRDATQAGPASPQVSLPWLSWLNAAGARIDQDCLSLNIWTPGLDGAKRPVMVWIHGGAFLTGAGSTGVYNGRSLALRGDVVIVTINYRLGALGYSHLGQLFGKGFEESSNLGVRDQIAALEWVRENIDRFGGDPGNVTLFGQSAGAMSIAVLLGVPRARNLFHRAICQSGAAAHVLEPEDAQDVTRVFSEELGGPPASHQALARIPLEHILQAQGATMRRLSSRRNIMVFLPAVDGDLITEQPLDAIRRGATSRIPLLIGSMLDEWKLFRVVDQGLFPLSEAALLTFFEEVLPAGFARAPDPKTALRDFRAAVDARGGHMSATDVWSAFQTARVFHFPASRLAEAQEEGGGSAYSYLFTWRTPTLRRALGAFHALDIPFVFGWTQHPLARPLTGLTGSAVRLSRKMQHAWTQFARYGSPGHESLPAWERYQPQRATMVLGRNCAPDEAPLEAERSLFESWAPPLAGATLPSPAASSRARAR
jgi:para-nitrobenzyl esterase